MLLLLRRAALLRRRAVLPPLPVRRCPPLLCQAAPPPGIAHHDSVQCLHDKKCLNNRHAHDVDCMQDSFKAPACMHACTHERKEWLEPQVGILTRNDVLVGVHGGHQNITLHHLRGIVVWAGLAGIAAASGVSAELQESVHDPEPDGVSGVCLVPVGRSEQNEVGAAVLEPGLQKQQAL